MITARTRDYLADLALKKGVALRDPEEVTQTQAGDKIDELKNLPDANFSQVSATEQRRFFKRLDAITKELSRWTLTG